jgi:hypothetical protein
VLDRETGLVWTRALADVGQEWRSAVVYCRVGFFGNRQGWRLPTYEELASLQDEHGQLPVSVFSGVTGQVVAAWTATTDEANPSLAWVLLPYIPAGQQNISFGLLQVTKSSYTNLAGKAWCVRGGGAAHSTPNN